MKHRHHHAKAEKKISVAIHTTEFPHHQKDNLWYVGMSLLMGALLIFLLYQREYLLSVVVLAFGAATFRLSRLEPQARKFEATERGVYWGEQFLPYHKLRAFWMVTTEDRSNLYLERLNFAPALHVVIPSNQAARLVGLLEEYLPHHDHRREPVSDQLARLLKL